LKGYPKSMTSSAARRQKKLEQRKQRPGAQKRKAKPREGEGGLVADEQARQNIGGLAKILKHNTDTFQQGFLANDVWLETFRLLITYQMRDIANLLGAAGLDTVVPMLDGDIDWRTVWEKGAETIQEKLQEAEQARASGKVPAMPPLISRQDSEVVEFGGDYTPPEESNASPRTEASS